MKNIIIYIFNIFLLIILLNSCENIKGESKYELSYAKNDSLSNQILPTSPRTLIIIADSVFVYDFEPYVPVRKGTVNKNKIKFENNEEVIFEVKNDYLITYEDSLIYYWKNKK